MLSDTVQFQKNSFFFSIFSQVLLLNFLKITHRKRGRQQMHTTYVDDDYKKHSFASIFVRLVENDIKDASSCVGRVGLARIHRSSIQTSYISIHIAADRQ